LKRLLFASVLALSTLWFSIPATAARAPSLPNAERTFTTGSLRVQVFGTPHKSTLIFIPGLTCGPWEWSNEIAQFSRAYRIYALTLPGFVGAPALQSRFFDTVSADFWTLLQQQHIEQPALIGHSLGGTLAILLAEQHPERLRSVIAVDGLPVFPGTESLSAQQRVTMAKQSSAAIAAVPRAQFAESQKRSLSYMVSSPQDVDSISQASSKADPGATAEWVYEDLALDLRSRLHDVTIPIAEIAPFDQSLDSPSKRQQYAALFRGAPNARVQFISPARHFLMYDRPDALHAAIEAFLNEPQAARHPPG
jgi:pimeloyl-ACP methyl ester carboxylesterase